MTREQAAEIHRHLLTAARAINRITRVECDFDTAEDRKAFGQLVGNACDAVHFEMLDKLIYRRFPDLRPPPPRRRWPINSKLKWHQVSLPPSVTIMDFDWVIFSELSRHWRKMARIVGNVSVHYAKLGTDLDPAIAAARLMAMVDTGLIEGFGDLRKWGVSEVRLKRRKPPGSD